MVRWCVQNFGPPGLGRWRINTDEFVFVFWNPEQATLFALRWV
jgi:hypothetical protein